MTRVLVIEDEPRLLKNIVETLQIGKYEVVGTNNGFDGVELVQTYEPDMILCDIMMPYMDGYQVLEQVRANSEIKRIPFVFLTAKTDWGSIRKGMELGADDYLLKPFNARDLFKAIDIRVARIKKVENQAVVKLGETKEQLAQAIARNLKDRLESVNTNVHHISNKMDILSSDELQDLLEKINEDASHLTRKTEQITYFVQARAGLLSKDQIAYSKRVESLPMLIESAIDRARIFLNHDHNVSINFDPDKANCDIQCFREIVVHAFAEILTNAIQGADDGGYVDISTQIDDEMVRIQIRDDGQMPDANALLTLDDILQLDTQGIEEQGFGIGLALAKLIVHSHEGHMMIESTLHSRTVMIEFPIAI